MIRTLSERGLAGLAAVVAGLALLLPVAVLGDSYTIIDLGNLGGPYCGAMGINDAGQVVGISALDFDPGGDLHGFLWDNGTMTDLGDLGGSSSMAYDVNEAGQVVGWAETAVGYQRPFLWENGVMTDLAPSIPNAHGAGEGINSAGDVAGRVGGAAYLWQGGTMINLGIVGGWGSPTWAHGINEAGQIVGETTIGHRHGFFWEDDGDPITDDMRDLGLLPGGLHSRARGINDAGQVVGWAQFDSTDLEDNHAVLWENLSWDAGGAYTGDMTDLGALPGGQRSFAHAINNAGTVVGYASSAGIGVSHAFVWDSVQGLQDLNDLIPAGSGWVLTSAGDINGSGQIAGTGTFNGQPSGFLLTPVPVTPPVFLRGDCNDDGAIDVGDAIWSLSHLFLGGPSGPCWEACDVNGTGALNLGDVITTLSVVFGPTVTPPPPPYPTCGSPPGSGPFNCDSFSSCP